MKNLVKLAENYFKFMHQVYCFYPEDYSSCEWSIGQWVFDNVPDGDREYFRGYTTAIFDVKRGKRSSKSVAAEYGVLNSNVVYHAKIAEEW